MVESWLQSAARASVAGILRRIQHGQLRIAIKYQDGDNRTEVYGKSKARKDQSDDEWVTVVFNSPNAWVRICQTFDLVRSVHDQGPNSANNRSPTVKQLTKPPT